MPLDVWIGLRRPRAGESASALPDEARRDVRYRLHSQSVEDHNRPDSKTGIDFLVPNLRLYLSGEQLEVEQCEAIRVARIVPSSDKKKVFEAAPNYAPPLLVLQASAALTNGLEEVLSLLEGRIPVVSGRMATISIADLPKLWMRYTLARATPPLRQLLESKATPPFALYLYLVELAGALGAFRLSAHAQFPKYDHEDPYPCFAYLFEQIKTDLKDALPDRFKEIRLPLRTQRLPDEGFLERALGPAQPGLSRHQVAALAGRAARAREAVGEDRLGGLDHDPRARPALRDPRRSAAGTAVGHRRGARLRVLARRAARKGQREALPETCATAAVSP